jgi:hypothetical protein
VTYWNSFYWDPDATGYALDIVTLGDDGAGTFLPLDNEVIDNLSVEAHIWDVNGGYDTGAFSPFEIVQIGPGGANLLNFVAGLPGMTPVGFDAFEASKQFQDLSAHPDKFIGAHHTPPFNVAVPEPSTFVLFGIGIFSVLGYGWRRRKKQAA